jgi:hypothetical protein
MLELFQQESKRNRCRLVHVAQTAENIGIKMPRNIIQLKRTPYNMDINVNNH